MRKKKIDLNLDLISETVKNLFVNQNRIDDVVGLLNKYNLEVLSSKRKLKSIAKKLKIGDEDFDNEFSKNSFKKNWIRNLSKRSDKKWVLFSKKEDVDNIDKRLKEITELTLMTHQEIYEICSQVNKGVKESSGAKKEMIEANLRLVISIAKKYTNRGLQLIL